MNNISYIFPIITAVITIGGVLYSIFSRFGKLELKVDTLWDFIIRRSMSEIVLRGAGEMKSPVTLREDLLALYEPIKKDLQIFVKNQKKPFTDRELFILIQKEFGNRILEEVVIPNGLPIDVSTIAAVIVGKGNNSFELEEGKNDSNI